MRRFLPVLLLSCLLGIFLSGSATLFAQAVSKESAIEKYEKAVSLAEELSVYEIDTLKVLPKIKIASEALLSNDFEQADRVLEDALADLHWLQTQKPTKMERTLRLDWLEVYLQIIQKMAILAILAYLLIRFGIFRRMLQRNRMTSHAKIYLALIMSAAAIFLSYFDLTRYGSSAFAFFDIHIVLIVVGALTGGMVTGLMSAVLIGLFRFTITQNVLIYLVVTLMVAGIGGYFGSRIKVFTKCRKVSILAGLLTGLVHGAIIYSPLYSKMPIFYILISILFIALLETVAVFMFMEIIAGVLREHERREIEKDLLTTQLRFLQAQISPHFLYNALNTISTICGRENAPQARGLVLRLADFFRGTLRRVEDLVTLRQEMEHVDSYLDIEKARFQDRLHVEKRYEIDEALWNVKIPFLMVQPLVENAVKYGISRKESGGKITLTLREVPKGLEIEVKDDGAGVSPGKLKTILNGERKADSTGIGLANIQQRLERFLGVRDGLCFESEKGKGMKVTMRIPIKKKRKQPPSEGRS